jgi:thioredoxin-dependent peroxiredoxin
VILGASFDPIDANAAFAQKFDFPFRLLCDTGREVGVAYGAADDPQAGAARRVSYLIDPEGKVRACWGTESRLDPKTHPREVLDTLQREDPRP